MKLVGFTLMFLLFWTSGKSTAQTYSYLVRFTDRNNSPYSVNQPSDFLSQRSIDRRKKQGIQIQSNDLPPNPDYLQELSTKGAKVIYTTRWLNGALINCSELMKDQILQLPFVSHMEFDAPLKVADRSEVLKNVNSGDSENLNYGDAAAQLHLLGVDTMHEAGYFGDGLLIAVLDDGFQNAAEIECLDSIFAMQRVRHVFDFVDSDSSVFTQGGHGTRVLSCMAGFLSGSIIAPAYRSEYILFRTEDGASESRIEEAYWLLAAERADSLGADILNSSLGYSLFDNPADNYTKADMDGNTTLVTRAADIAASKGMVIVNSAGNSGGTAWNIITAPADADSVIAVGAINTSGVVAAFSSRGPTADLRVKPDVTAVGSQTVICRESGEVSNSNGTSFSAPLTAGMIAGLWQSVPHLTAAEITDCVRRSGHQYENPDISSGYGQASWTRASQAAIFQYPIKYLQKTETIETITFHGENTVRLKLKLSQSLQGKNLRITLIDQLTPEILYQHIAINVSEILDLPVNFNKMEHHILLRIENLTDATTAAIFRF